MAGGEFLRGTDHLNFALERSILPDVMGRFAYCMFVNRSSVYPAWNVCQVLPRSARSLEEIHDDWQLGVIAHDYFV